MWLKRIFGKRDEATVSNDVPKAARKISLAEAKILLYQRLAHDETNALKECAGLRDTLIQTVAELKTVVNALARADVPERTATASKAIKDGFAQRAMAALGRVNIREWQSVTAVMDSCLEIEHTLAAVSVGPREAMHVKFFFDEHMGELAARIHASFSIIAEVRKRLSPAAEKRKQIEKIFHELEAGKQAVANKNAGISQAKQEIARAKVALDDVKLYDLAELERLRAERAQLEHAIAAIDQQVASAISPAFRLLKRFAHVADKHAAKFILQLEDEPATFYGDEERVKAVLASAVAAIRSGQIVADEKEVRKAERVLETFDDIITFRERRDAAVRSIDSVKALIEREVVKERENAAMAERMKSFENAAAQDEMRVVNLKREVSEAEQQLAGLKQKLSQLLVEIGIELE